MTMSIKMKFLGAAQNVTGSRYLVEANGTKLYVDCGLVQEWKLKDRNWAPFAVPPKDTDAVLLTHGHLDHCGLLPRLAKLGFSGPIHCTKATAEIAGIVLLDSGYIQEADAAYKKKRHAKEGRKGPRPVTPLYTKDDAEATLPLFTPHAFDKPVQIAEGIEATFLGCGHILGAASVKLRVSQGDEERTILFSGDLGRWDMPILKDPEELEKADYVVMESTYGNRVHEKTGDLPAMLAKIINETREAGGHVIIPSFSVERAQDLLFYLSQLLSDGRIQPTKVLVDSPMAIRVTEVFKNHPELFDEETMAILYDGKHPCDFPGLKMCRTVDESKAIAKLKEPAIIIAGSGMCTGGRIKHHLINNISQPEHTVLFIGYQAMGTPGRHILSGADKVRIHGQERPIAARIEQMGGFSAHAGQDELLRWISSLKENPRHVFVTHGEPESAQAFAELLNKEKGYETSVPAYEDEVILD